MLVQILPFSSLIYSVKEFFIWDTLSTGLGVSEHLQNLCVNGICV